MAVNWRALTCVDFPVCFHTFKSIFNNVLKVFSSGLVCSGLFSVGLMCTVASFSSSPILFFLFFHQVMKEEWSSQTIAASCCSV